MIKLNGEVVNIGHFPDGSLLLKEDANITLFLTGALIEWYFENNEELVALIYLTKHLRANGTVDIDLIMPYIPNSRMDRVKNTSDVFTLKYFADIINSLNFNTVTVVDPHSSVSEALIDRIEVNNAEVCITDAIAKCEPDMLFFPDSGAMKRYSEIVTYPYCFGIKRRNWTTGKIEGLDVVGEAEHVKGKNFLIIDDICSRGGTFLHSARKLKELGANKIYLYVTHCENTILEGELLDGDLIEKVFTTNSIFTKSHEKIEVFEL